MSSTERDRLAMFRQVEARQITQVEASAGLSISYRQTKRLWKRYLELGDAGLVHGLRGRASNNQTTSDGRRERALGLYRAHYRGFGPTLAAEQMCERDGLVVDHETLRGWLVGAGLWQSRRQPRRSHRRRPRRACFGELVQLDGSDHAWFGEEHDRCVLMVMVDDATGRTLARFFAAETTEASMLIFRSWSLQWGLPRSLYPDRHSIYRRNDKEAAEIEHRTGTRPLTRFGEAMQELGVELICAHSPQAKGRVERMNGTLQDRLVKLLKLEGITTLEAANAYLGARFLPAHNAKFSVEAADATDVHRPVNEEELDGSLCPLRERRVVDQTGCVSWRGRWLELTGLDATPRRRREVVVCQRLNGQVQLLSLDGGRVLASRELPCRPRPKLSYKPPLAKRVAGHADQKKPAKNHPWRSPVLGSVSATSSAAPRPSRRRPPSPNKGTLLLG